MKLFGSLASAVVGLVMALAMVVWAVVAVVVIAVVGFAVALGGSLLRVARRFHEPSPSQASSTPGDLHDSETTYIVAGEDFVSGGRP